MAIRYSLFAIRFWLLAFGLRLAAWRLSGLARENLLAFSFRFETWRLSGFARKNLLAFSLRFETWRLGGLARNIFTARLHKNIKKGT